MTIERLFQEQRHELLLDELRRHGAVRVRELARDLGVSELTIRRDIAALAARNLVNRVHGGATLPSRARPAGRPRTANTGFTIGMVVPSLDFYWPPIVAGARHAAAALGVNIQLRGSTYDPAEDRRQISRLIEAGQVQGLLLAPNLGGPHWDNPHPDDPRSGNPHRDTPPPGRPHPGAPHPGGSHPAEPHSGGPHPAGPHPAGPHPAGPHPAGPHPDAPHPSGPHQGAPHTAGPHPAGPYTAAPHPSAPRPEADGAMLDWIGRLPVPAILVERQPQRWSSAARQIEWVRSDHALGLEMAVQHLNENGHDRIGLVLDPGSPTSAYLERGWHRDGPVIFGVPRSLPAGVTALIVHSDPQAIAVAQACAEHGVRIPDDLALISYDDELAHLAEPPLTAIRPPKNHVGRLAVELMVSRLLDGDRPPARGMLVAPELVVRCSTLNVSGQLASHRGAASRRSVTPEP